MCNVGVFRWLLVAQLLLIRTMSFSEFYFRTICTLTSWRRFMLFYCAVCLKVTVTWFELRICWSLLVFHAVPVYSLSTITEFGTVGSVSLSMAAFNRWCSAPTYPITGVEGLAAHSLKPHPTHRHRRWRSREQLLPSPNSGEKIFFWQCVILCNIRAVDISLEEGRTATFLDSILFFISCERGI